MMEQFKGNLDNFYTFENDENARGKNYNAGLIEFITTKKYMNQVIPQNSKILDACAGCGFYSFFLAEQGHQLTAGDYVEHNVNEIKKFQAQTPILHGIYKGNVIDLSEFSNESFDVVLNMGAYYHLLKKEERDKSIAECLRVLRPNGLFFLAYLNKFSNFIAYHEQWKDDFARVEKVLEKGYVDNDCLFYTSTPEEVEETIFRFGIKILYNIATDGLKANIYNTINSMNDELFNRYLDYHFKICEIKSILGYSEHALAICQK